MGRFEVIVYYPKQGVYKTHIFSKIDSVREYINANRKAIEDYDLCICEIKEVRKLNLEDFGL
jgi:hypothetical protein